MKFEPTQSKKVNFARITISIICLFIGLSPSLQTSAPPFAYAGDFSIPLSEHESPTNSEEAESREIECHQIARSDQLKQLKRRLLIRQKRQIDHKQEITKALLATHFVFDSSNKQNFNPSSPDNWRSLPLLT